jgi:hypothetical protein
MLTSKTAPSTRDRTSRASGLGGNDHLRGCDPKDNPSIATAVELERAIV